MDKWIRYAAMLQDQIGKMFEDESENHIDIKDLEDADNCTQFFHALANAMPTRIYCKLTGDDVDTLGFNHVANRLCFQFSEKMKPADTDL